ncbi:MAG: hypothetical protein ABJB86_06200 [Bacteroidota bacterium]
MKKIIPYVLMVSAAFGTMSLQAQTADEIVSKHIDALGGKDVIKKVNSIYMEGSTQVMGNESPTTETILNGKGYKNESDFNGQKMVQCVNDKGGWTTNPMAGGGAQAMPDEAYNSARGQLNVGGALYDYTAKGSTVTLLGKDGSAYKLKLVTADKDETTYYIDGSTYYISKLVKKGNVMGQDVEITIAYTDYKKTDIGYVIPFTRNIDLGQFQVSTTFTKAEINKPVDPAIFNMPK